MSEASAERTLNGLCLVTLGGAQLRPMGGKRCPLCADRCNQLIRFELAEGPSGTIFAARRYCDGQAVFAAVPAVRASDAHLIPAPHGLPATAAERPLIAQGGGDGGRGAAAPPDAA